MTAKTKEPLTTKQKAQIATLSAGGLSQNKIAKHIGRSRHAVKNTCPSPKYSRPSFSSPYDMTRVSGTSSLLTVRTL